MDIGKQYGEISNANPRINGMEFDPNKMFQKIEQSKLDVPRDIITRNESLVGDLHPITGVPFERKVVELPSGEKIEGVFPKFESQFDAKIQEKDYLVSDKDQFRECNKQLYEKMEYAPKFKQEMIDKYGKDFVEQVKDGCETGAAPDGFVWHHNEEPGKIQLVDAKIHACTGHTGGRAIWGGGSDNR